MKNKEESLTRTTARILLYSSLVFTMTIFLVYFYISIINPSLNSVALACKPQEAEENGLRMAGETIVTTQDNGTKEVRVTFYVDEPSNKLLKHEFVHIIQSQRLLSFPNTCKYFGFYKVLREMEAYSSSYLPDKIYKKLYGNFEILGG